MSTVSQNVTLNADADAVWQVVGDFKGLDRWHKLVNPYPTEGSGVGAVRTLSNPDGSTFTEVLSEVDEAERRFVYIIPNDQPTPFTDYHSTLQVTDEGSGRCTFTWSADFGTKKVPLEKLQRMMTGFIGAGMEGVKAIFEPTE